MLTLSKEQALFRIMVSEALEWFKSHRDLDLLECWYGSVAAESLSEL